MSNYYYWNCDFLSLVHCSCNSSAQYQFKWKRSCGWCIDVQQSKLNDCCIYQNNKYQIARQKRGANGEDSVCIYRILDGYTLDCSLNRSFEIMSMSFAFYYTNKSIVLHYIPRDYGHLFAKEHLFISFVYSILFEVACTLCACSLIFINQQNEVVHILWTIFICLIIILLTHRLILLVAYNSTAIFHKNTYTPNFISPTSQNMTHMRHLSVSMIAWIFNNWLSLNSYICFFLLTVTKYLQISIDSLKRLYDFVYLSTGNNHHHQQQPPFIHPIWFIYVELDQFVIP